MYNETQTKILIQVFVFNTYYFVSFYYLSINRTIRYGYYKQSQFYQLPINKKFYIETNR